MKEQPRLADDARVTPSLFLRLFENDALMKGVDRKKCVIVLNKYDACTKRDTVTDLAKAVLEKTGTPQVILSSAYLGIFYSVERVSDG